MSELKQAQAVSSYTLLASRNCFSVCVGQEDYLIVNFYYESLEELLKLGLTFPVQILVLSGETAVIHDARIPDKWYNDHFCEVCCPEQLLPLPQQLRHQRLEKQGVRTRGKGWVNYSFSKEPSALWEVEP